MKKIIAFILIAVMLFLTGCSSKNEEVFVGGGELLNAYSVLWNDSMQYNFPIITNKEIKEIEIKNVSFSNDVSLVCSIVSFSEGFEYRGFYSYSVIVKISSVDAEKPINVDVDCVNFMINGSEYAYYPQIHLINSSELKEQYDVKIEKKYVKINSSLTTIFGYVPSVNEKFGRMFELELITERDIVAESFIVPGNDLEITEFYFDDETTDYKTINREVAQGKTIRIKCGFSNAETKADDSILVSPFIFIYSSNGEKYALFVDGGVQIYKNYTESNNDKIKGVKKTYIDNLITNSQN